MWTDADRSRYRQAGDCLPSDLSHAEWDRLAPLIPPAKPGGRPRQTDMRLAMNAIFYLLRTGCPWRYLPHGVFPPRERLGREASPSAGVIDSQSLKSAEKGDVRKVKQTPWVMTPARR